MTRTMPRSAAASIMNAAADQPACALGPRCGARVASRVSMARSYRTATCTFFQQATQIAPIGVAYAGSDDTGEAAHNEAARCAFSRARPNYAALREVLSPRPAAVRAPVDYLWCSEARRERKPNFAHPTMAWQGQGCPTDRELSQ